VTGSGLAPPRVSYDSFNPLVEFKLLGCCHPAKAQSSILRRQICADQMVHGHR
jgi:hypothetical protein